MSNDTFEKHWSRLLPVLSLDIATPFFVPMEVPVHDQGAFQNSLRDAMLVIRLAKSNRVLPGLTTLKHVVDALGQTASLPFLKWGQAAFLGNHPDQPDWSAWSSVFTHFASLARSGRLFLLPDQTQDYFTDLYRQRTSMTDIDRQQENVARNPLSDWDLGVYIEEQYGVAWESGPFSVTQSIIEIVRLKRFAAEFWPNLTPDERAEFHNRAQAWITENRVWMPGPLPTLDSLLRTQ